VVHMLLKHGTNPNLESNGFTPMHKACSNGQDDAITYLLQHGANPNCKDLNLKTPVFLAIENGQFNSV